jgi:hypothetical protein
MFKILPSQSLILHSPLTAVECENKLREFTEEMKPFKLSWKAPIYSKCYIGFVLDGEFEIHRNITYRNSFLPIIRGKINRKESGSEIKISMKLDPFVKGFMFLWLGFTFLFCIAVIMVLFKASFSPFFIIPFIMAIFGLILSHGAFNYERKKSENDLKNIFEADQKQTLKQKN